MATPSSRGLPPTPPDKGSFPLDHFGACRDAQKMYLECVKEQKTRSTGCKDVMKQFLECRMQHGLMATEDLGQLGFRAHEATAAAAAATTPQKSEGK